MSTLAERQTRIIATHAGSLPRRTSLSAMLLARMNKQPFDAAALARETRKRWRRSSASSERSGSMS
jgi:hypothetical protein